MTHAYRPRFDTNHILKYADDTTVVGLFWDKNKLAYREEVRHLQDWCKMNNVILNVNKTKEIIEDFKKSRPYHTTFHIKDTKCGSHVQHQIPEDAHCTHTGEEGTTAHTLTAKDEQSFSPHFHSNNILQRNCISIWCGSCWAVDWKSLQRVVVRTAQNITRSPLPPSKILLAAAEQSPSDSGRLHPPQPQTGHRRFCSICCGTARFANSFFPLAIKLLNKE